MMSTLEWAAEVERLQRRISEVESERDAMAAENAELRFFQQMATAISALRDIDDIVQMLLRYVCEILVFERAVFFHVDADGGIRRHLERLPNGEIVPAEGGQGYRAGSLVEYLVDGRSPLAVGSAADADRPLEDTQGAYCMVPLATRGQVQALLYADSEFSTSITERQTSLMTFFAGQAAIAIENARLYQETQDLALTDPLTGLSNRRALGDQLEHEMHSARRNRTQIAYAIIDVDDFKRINDTHGHQVGDKALKVFADCLRLNSRKGDIVARFAGDEFVVVMCNTNPDAARLGVERIQQQLRKSDLRCSIGVGMFPADAEDTSSLLSAADRALYVAKARGKDQYSFASDREDVGNHRVE